MRPCHCRLSHCTVASCPPLPFTRTETHHIHFFHTSQGLDVAKKALLDFLEGFREPIDVNDREALRCVAGTSLRTKLRSILGTAT